MESWWGYIGGAALTLAIFAWWRKGHASPASGPALDTSGGKAPPWWTPADYKALAATSARLGINPANLLAIMRSESGLNPSAMYPGGIARGLTQITEAGRASAGLSESDFEDFQNWSIQEQLPRIEKYMREEFAGSPPQTAGGLYAYNFLPAYAREKGTAPDTVLASVEDFPADSALDYDDDGQYEVRDLSNRLARYGARKDDGSPVDTLYLGALQGLRDATGDQSISPVW